MSIYLNQNFIVENSSKEFYRFYLTDEHKIKYDLLTNDSSVHSKILIEKPVLDYAVDIDVNDKLHLLCITKDGDLLYFIYNKERWIKNTLSKFDVKSNKYKHLTLKVNQDNIHIFFSYCNLINQNIWTIQHIVGNKGKWERKNILSINSGKFISPFYVDFDSLNNIHLIYNSLNNGVQHIYYTSFSSFLNRWYNIPQKISENNANNSQPYIFVDTKNNIHVLWCIICDRDLQLVYRLMPFIESNTYRWKDISIPLAKGKISQPLMFEDNGILRVVFKNNSQLNSIYSSDGGYNWQIDNSVLNIECQDIKLIKYCSSPSLKSHYKKINHIYGEVDKGITLFFVSSHHFPNIVQNTLSENLSNNDSYNTEIPKNCKISIINESNIFNNDVIDKFVANTKANLDLIFSKTKEINNIKRQIEQIIYKNSKELDNRLTSTKSQITDIVQEIETLEDLIEKYKTENYEFLKLLIEIKEKYDQSSNDINALANQVTQLKEFLEQSSKPNFIERIINFFRQHD